MRVFTLKRLMLLPVAAAVAATLLASRAPYSPRET